jgi:hypothetical protein
VACLAGTSRSDHFTAYGILQADKAKEMVSPAFHSADLMGKKLGDYWLWTQVGAENGLRFREKRLVGRRDGHRGYRD